MTINVQNPKLDSLRDESYACAEDLTNYQWCCVKFTSSVTSGEATLSAPTAAGARIAGVLQNADADTTHRGVVRKLGMTKLISGAAIAAGAEVMVANTAGEVITATGSGAYVVGVAREACSAAHTAIAVELYGQYTYP